MLPDVPGAARDDLFIGYSDKTPHISGNEIRCPCPVHKGDGLNLAINTDKHSWFCHSKGCKGKGLIDLYKQANGLKYRDAAEQLAGRFGIPVQYKQIEGEKGMSQKEKYSIQDVNESWERANENGADVYFSDKGLSPPPGVRFGKNAYGYPALLVPLKDIEGQLKGVISIGESKNGETKKFQFKIDNLDGAFFNFGSFEGASEVIVGEGVATVQTAWKLLGCQIPAASAGSWSNIPKVVRELKKKHPNIKPIILIDVDGGGKGEQAAATVAKEFSDASFRMPCFENCDPDKWKKGEPPTDFNDLMQLAGENETIRQLKAHHPREELKVEEKVDESKKESVNRLEIIPYTLEDLQKDLSSKKEGLLTGYKALDEMIRIPNEAVTLIAGRPSHGKTTVMLNLLLNIVIQYPDHHFYFFSYEETRSQLAIKLITILSEHMFNDGSKNLLQIEGYIKSGSTDIRALEIGKKTYQELVSSKRLMIVDQPYHVNDLSNQIARLKSNVPLGGVFIDYIQKIKNKSKFGTRQLELQKTSEVILETAKRSSIPIILGAQLGRDRDSRNKVKLDNLREAGDLEQDANLVLGIFNPSMETAQEEGQQLITNVVELSITPLKNRNGVVNKPAILKFDRPILKIKNG